MKFVCLENQSNISLPVNKGHSRVSREHEITNVRPSIGLPEYLRNASITMNTSRSNNCSGRPTGSSPRSRKSWDPFPVAKPGRTFLYGKKPRAKDHIPASCRIDERTSTRHNSRVFIRGPLLSASCVERVVMIGATSNIWWQAESGSCVMDDAVYMSKRNLPNA